MTGYTKLFESILESTVWLEALPTKVVWITMLAMADRDGRVEASVPGLAKRAGVDREDCEIALAVFLAPDPDSRTVAYGGRRIEVIPGGWRLLNYDLYRERASLDEARERAAERKRRQRAAEDVTGCHSPSQAVTPCHALSRDVTDVPVRHAIAEAKAEEEAEKKIFVSPTGNSKIAIPSNGLVSTEIANRAGWFLEQYPAWYAEHRNGAVYRLKPARDYYYACQLVDSWSNERLAKMAELFLRVELPDLRGKTRTVGEFLHSAPWCDSELRRNGQ